MIIEEFYGDLWKKLDLDKPAGTNTSRLVAHGCNAKGVMGAGFAKQVRQKYPECYLHYKKELVNNTPYGGPKNWGGNYISWQSEDESIEILNCITQIEPGPHADLDFIRSCLYNIWTDLMDDYEGDTPIYMPRIGCGIGGLDYVTEVKPILEASELRIVVCHIFT